MRNNTHMRNKKRMQRLSCLVLFFFVWLLFSPGIVLAQGLPETSSTLTPQKTAPAIHLLASLSRIPQQDPKPTLSPEAQQAASLSNIFNQALYHTQDLLKQVIQGKSAAVPKLSQKTKSLEGVVSAIQVHFNQMEKSISSLLSEGKISRRKEEVAEEKVQEAEEPIQALITKLEQVSVKKSLGENQRIASQALLMLESLIQETNPLAHQLPNPKTFQFPNRTGFKLVQPKNPYQYQDPPLKPAPPTSADLEPTEDVQITPAIQAEAASLGYNPAKELAFVHDQYFFEPYYGAEKGSEETFYSYGGDDQDQASLLIALLRASNIPARYETGIVTVKAAEVENWLSVSNTFVALDVLQENGIPAAATKKDDTIGNVVFVHTWVTAFLHHRWVKIDPSFKQYTFDSGVNPLGISGFNVNTMESDAANGATINPQDFYFTNINFTAGENYLNQTTNNLVSIASAQYPNYTIGQLFGGRAIIPLNLSKVEKEMLKTGKPSVLPYRVKKLLSISDTIPSNLHMTASFNIGGISFTSDVEQIVNQKLWIEYEPATPQDAAIIQAAGGIYNVIPAYLVNMVPVLKEGSQVIGVGSAVPLGSEQTLTSTFSEPNFQPDTNQKILFAGGVYTIGLDAQRGFIEPSLSQMIQQARIEIQSGSITPGIVSDVLFATAKSYWAETDIDAQWLGQASDVVWSRSGPGEAVTDQDLSVIYVFGLPYQVSPGGYSIDVKRNVFSPFSKTGNTSQVASWFVSSGAMGSADEGVINQEVHQVSSVDTIEILKLASQAEIPIYLIYQGNINQILSDLQIDPGIKQFIAQEVSLGLYAVVPQTNVTLNQWSGIGFMVLNPTDGTGSYFIAGGIGGLIQVSNGGATSTGTPPPLGDKSLDKSVRASLNNKAQALLNAATFTHVQAGTSEAIAYKKMDRTSLLETSVGLGVAAIIAGIAYAIMPGNLVLGSIARQLAFATLATAVAASEYGEEVYQEEHPIISIAPIPILKLWETSYPFIKTEEGKCSMSYLHIDSIKIMWVVYRI